MSFIDPIISAENYTLFNQYLESFELSFELLKTSKGLKKLDEAFVEYLPLIIKEKLLLWRNSAINLPAVEQSEFQIELGKYLNQFITDIFQINELTIHLAEKSKQYKSILDFKERFVIRGAKRYRKPIDTEFLTLYHDVLRKIGGKFSSYDELEQKVANYANALEIGSNEEEQLIQWIVHALNLMENINEQTNPENALIVKELKENWISFKLPQRKNYDQLVSTNKISLNNISVHESANPLRKRDGFNLTDCRMNSKQVASEVDYCKYCHDHEGDFCSKGFPVKKGVEELGFKKDPFNNLLLGCPLEEKISEMQCLQKEGYLIGALAMIMIENPMVPATGHRICNDCMKACIYQKQDAVNIPEIETSVLTDVLDLDWGVEIYDLLTKWNPLKQKEFLPFYQTGKKVMVAGLGPAGFTMTHYLSQAGCFVLAIDGLKLEPLPKQLIEQPVKSWQSLTEELGSRILSGFGGVAEYGITVRWDKNFLKLIYLVLSRRKNVQLFGGVRLGGTLTIKDALDMGFDHISVAVGAGLPRVLNIENSLARGMRQASDFLMAMQLTGAAKETSLANLQVRLPAVVIGGGLTAIDAATEVQAYYIKQVEKVFHRVEKLGEEAVRKGLSEEDNEILSEFLTHGRQVKEERERASKSNEKPDFISLLKKWGGVLLAYRKGMKESPAYTLNHEEITKALEEGIFYGENLDPKGVSLDRYGHIKSIYFNEKESISPIEIQARCVLVAAGTVPNIIYEKEYPQTFVLEGNHFKGFSLEEIQAGKLTQEKETAIEHKMHAKSQDFKPFTSYSDPQYSNKHISYIGDTHPVFNGNVVKAITSAKRTSKQIISLLDLEDLQKENSKIEFDSLKDHFSDQFNAIVESINVNHNSMVEVWIKAPMAAKNFKPGQFFRLQTFEQNSEIVENTRLQIPVLTVSGTGVKDDCIRLMVMQWGTGPRLVPRLKTGDQVVLAGPTGAPTEIPSNKTILVIAGRWGAAVMLDIGLALKEAGNKVIYLATFERAEELDCIDELEIGTDKIIWTVQKGEQIKPRRPQDVTKTASDIVSLLQELSQEKVIDLLAIDKIMAMGSTGLLKGLQLAISPQGILSDYFRKDLEITGTVGSPMQCMMKGVCGQCLQWLIDPNTGKRTHAIFACAGQDQNLKAIDLDNLSARTSQNRLLERISAQWLTYVLAKKTEEDHLRK